MSAVISPVGNANMVHESEAQRQHARLKLPAKVRFQGQQGGVQEVELIDLSAGGFSFEQGSQSVVEGKLYRGKLMFKVEGIGFAMDVEFQVRSIIGGKRVGCEFHNLRPREMSALRYIISSLIGGELVNVGGLISILQRENFTKARGGKGNEKLSLLGRLRAMGLTLVILLAGLAAFAYVLYQCN